MTATVTALLILGLTLLLVGGEWLVRGSSRLALAFGISPLVIGLTVVAFGTSAPELAVSLLATLGDQGGLAIGNVLGSNIANILLILGASSLVAPLAVSMRLIRLDVPLMIGSSLLAWWLSSTGVLSRYNGIALVALLVGYTVFAIYKSRSETQEIRNEYEAEFGAAEDQDLTSPSTIIKDLLLIGFGIGMLILGSRWVVDGASAIAKAIGVSDLVIGLTIVAIGTSLPELATSVVAVYKGERDIAVGNVIGSNLFNILCVLGITATVLPGGIPVPREAIAFDFPVMIAVSLLSLPVMFLGGRIERWEGALFLFAYAIYLAHTVIISVDHPMADQFRAIAVFGALPSLILLVALSTFLSLRRQRS